MIANRSSIRGNARSHLIATAWTLIAAGGVGSFSMREAADAADVSLGTVTYHFKNRQDLVDAALTELAAHATQTVDVALRSARQEPRDVAPRILINALRDLWGNRVAVLAGAELRIHGSRSAAARADAAAHRSSGLRMIRELHKVLGRPHDRTTIEATIDLLDAQAVRMASRHQSTTSFEAAMRRHLAKLYAQT